MKHVLVLLFILFLSIHADLLFYDDFEDNYIGDWEERCWPADWYCEYGQAKVTNAVHCCGLITPGDISVQNCQLKAYGSAEHVFGVMARLDSNDNGVFGFVSPDQNVARIRLIENGSSTEFLNSIYDDFPDDDYIITFTCMNDSLHLKIEAQTSGSQWEFSAIDPNPVSGQFGLMAGDEYQGNWDWFSATDNSEAIIT
ncbi:MAG: hypothetical protein GF388_03315, partial [Candidatus Aegiribacteria sp.]|nr:hypothetical protein [Candidatus Aegiribacteria sp.]MBD3294296.1 hypothetical protein [Candidatus Fermentibacteria bacterium]